MYALALDGPPWLKRLPCLELTTSPPGGVFAMVVMMAGDDGGRSRVSIGSATAPSLGRRPIGPMLLFTQRLLLLTIASIASIGIYQAYRLLAAASSAV